MEIDAVLIEAMDRVRQAVPEVVAGLDEDQLAWRPDPRANSIAWLVWHLTRVADDHVAEVAGVEQVWTRDGWYERFALPFPPEAHGYGQGADEVGQVRVAADLLAGYHDAVAAMVHDYLGTLAAADLERVVDERWDPPVTLGVRLVSVIDDCAQHVGQAAYVRGMLERA
ncbi:MAG: mycothiol transferase [Marmoricola sp.]